MSLPDFTMRQLLEAGVHFGHNTRRWNPRMEPFIFGVRNGIHIIDLQQTVPMLHRAMVAVRDTVKSGGRLLFVGTKRAAGDAIKEAANTAPFLPMCIRQVNQVITIAKQPKKPEKALRIKSEFPNKSIHSPKRK